MINASAYQQYQDTRVLTATPGKLLLMAFDGAIRFVRQGQVFIERKQRHDQNRCITQAQRILLELMYGLDHAAAPALAGHLLRLYDYLLNRLVEANLHDDAAALEEVSRHLEGLRSAFAQAESQVMRGDSSPAGEPNAPAPAS
jgi:flagellar secretion chaperone FliS